jgi:hypothetical protein
MSNPRKRSEPQATNPSASISYRTGVADEGDLLWCIVVVSTYTWEDLDIKPGGQESDTSDITSGSNLCCAVFSSTTLTDMFISACTLVL